MENITVIGDGSWGTTLAIYLCKRKYNVKLWGVFPEYLKVLENNRENPKFLPEIKFPGNLKICFDVGKTISNSDLIIFAVPSKYMRSVLEQLSENDFADKVVLSVAKGMEENTFMCMSEVIKELIGVKKIAVLSGPTIAYEIANGMPAACVIASEDKQTRIILQDIFNSSNFRIYTSSDVKGVEICGAIKNIIAIAAGITDGIGYQTNTKAALLTRGIVEISRLGKKLGAQSETFSGLAGIGDLITTCFSKKSRNRTFGEDIGKGKKREDIVNSMDMVVEGVTTVKSIYNLGKKINIDLPIINQVYSVLYKDKSPLDAVMDLMKREVKPESR